MQDENLEFDSNIQIENGKVTMDEALFEAMMGDNQMLGMFIDKVFHNANEIITKTERGEDTGTASDFAVEILKLIAQVGIVGK